MDDIILKGKFELQCGQLDAASLGYAVATKIPDSDLQIVGTLNKFSIRNPSGAQDKYDEMKVKVDISGYKVSLPGDHPIVFLDTKPDQVKR